MKEGDLAANMSAVTKEAVAGLASRSMPQGSAYQDSVAEHREYYPTD